MPSDIICPHCQALAGWPEPNQHQIEEFTWVCEECGGHVVSKRAWTSKPLGEVELFSDEVARAPAAGLTIRGHWMVRQLIDAMAGLAMPASLVSSEQTFCQITCILHLHDSSPGLMEIRSHKQDLCEQTCAEAMTITYDRERSRHLKVVLILSEESQTLPDFSALMRSEGMHDCLLPVPFGFTDEGEAMIEDLHELQHVLIAGHDSEALDSLLYGVVCGLTAHHMPEMLKVFWLDVQGGDLIDSFAEGHVEMRDSMAAIQEECLVLGRVIDVRFQQCRAAGVRTAEQYHARLVPDAPIDERMQTLVVVLHHVDVLMRQWPQLELEITKLTAKGHKVGIHLIVASTNPTHDTYTGIIKSNIQARLCLRVASKHDSRLVLDQGGAEQLHLAHEYVFKRRRLAELVMGHAPHRLVR